MGYWLARPAPARPTDVVSPLEPAPDGDPLPLVALLVATDAPLHSCLAEQLGATERFRLVEPRRAKQLMAAEGVPAGQPMVRSRAVDLARQLGAELALFAAKPHIIIADVLTGEEALRQPRNAGGSCAGVADAMVRVVLGEGRVTAVRGDRVTVNLGWRSRVAPGAHLQVLRDGTPVGTIQVDKVELDQSLAHGRARVGDVVRLGDRHPPSKIMEK